MKLKTRRRIGWALLNWPFFLLGLVMAGFMFVMAWCAPSEFIIAVAVVGLIFGSAYWGDKLSE